MTFSEVLLKVSFGWALMILTLSSLSLTKEMLMMMASRATPYPEEESDNERPNIFKRNASKKCERKNMAHKMIICHF